jgi:glycerol-3-phosphate dehydrogenase
MDALIVGGGINGAGIARDLAGRGLRVMLVEQDDLASHTSSCSTKLIHGGLRYLEHYEFSLVRKALAERELLLRCAPHIMWPLRFVMPHDAAMRPVWMIRAGLFLYDHLARREFLPASETVRLAQHEAGAPLKAQFQRGFVYSDAWVDDARLVLLCAMDAANRGATIHTRCRCEQARQVDGAWQADLVHADGRRETVRARALVNAAGPWAAKVLGRTGATAAKALRLIKGSHIVVRKRFDHPHAYILQNPDGRIIFIIPYEGDFTLIGTTDVEWQGEPGAAGAAQIEDTEIAYLCEQASRYLRQSVLPSEVVWSYAGLRPLLDDEAGNPAAVTRDYRLELDSQGAPLLSVWGGKITTFRKLAEEAAQLLCGALGSTAPAWTASAKLPGGDFTGWVEPSGRPDTDAQRFVQALAQRAPQVAAGTRARWARSYGALVQHLLAAPSLGAEVAPGLHEAELHYLRQHEWARTVDDVLWRRSKLGLHLGAAGRVAVDDWWREHPAATDLPSPRNPKETV